MGKCKFFCGKNDTIKNWLTMSFLLISPHITHYKVCNNKLEYLM